MNKELIHHSFSSRLAALDALNSHDPEAVSNAADELNLLGKTYGHYFPGADVLSYSEALSCLVLAWRWRDAIRIAEPDAVRFSKAIRLRAKEYFDDLESRKKSGSFDTVIQCLAEIDSPSDIEEIEAELKSRPLGFSSRVPERGVMPERRRQDRKPPPKPEIAFVKFDINGSPAKSIDRLEANLAHDFSVHIRVANWPETSKHLILEPVSLENPTDYSLPKFVIEKPTNVKGPHSFERNGRVILRLSQAIGAKPFEFKYRAVFEPSDTAGDVNLVGHRTIRLESVDATRRSMSGYAGIDQKLLEIRQKLRTMPGLSMSDLESSLILLARLGNLAGQAVQDAKFPAGMSEAEFQSRVLEFLRSDRAIGSEMEEHPRSGGGITDLSYRQIRLELKAEKVKSPSPKILSAYADQTAQYVVSTGKKVGILCVLDSTKKTAPPVPAESLFRVEPKQMHVGGIAIVSLIIQGGLARPSDLSR